ncbi:Metal-dependent hydrolase, endonuclease/exonuclease/phosphatase family [Thermoactinomyces sp. DSM 45891]|uniref:endonuclease/exonuclease/phosphatase family protein n=1 Tax=Thermoactinomyces sp. DSM 45891 TaxID=1761907 RepID=UPI00091DFB3D|nr:endonuclease/exonuclease/phosphatase family protein [Thermoactinomyces sp. DSM 45891]SFX28006.1 Metal-dependent hydrolase, endonuclease/exonuclease/phosphatase family [Thermoactinomyces sp. DSM 45891]
MKLRVMTFNIHHGKGTDRRIDLQRIAKIIADHQCDVVGLNEVDCYFSKRSHYVNQIDWLAKSLGMNYAYGHAISSPAKKRVEHKRYGNAILSRYPISFEQNHLFQYPTRLMENRSLLESHIQLPSQTLHVCTSHLSLNPWIHRKQVNYILHHCLEHSLPTIVMGDWNMRPKSKPWKKVTYHFTDVCKANDPTMRYATFPSLRPRTQLDYIFVSRDLFVQSAEVVQSNPLASDHLPLLTTISLSH